MCIALSATICIVLNLCEVIDEETNGMVMDVAHMRTGPSPFACGVLSEYRLDVYL